MFPVLCKECGKKLPLGSTFPRKHIPCESFLSLLGKSNFEARLRTSSCNNGDRNIHFSLNRGRNKKIL
jgi:hypothetical protein